MFGSGKKPRKQSGKTSLGPGGRITGAVSRGNSRLRPARGALGYPTSAGSWWFESLPQSCGGTVSRFAAHFLAMPSQSCPLGAAALLEGPVAVILVPDSPFSFPSFKTKKGLFQLFWANSGSLSSCSRRERPGHCQNICRRVIM